MFYLVKYADYIIILQPDVYFKTRRNRMSVLFLLVLKILIFIVLLLPPPFEHLGIYVERHWFGSSIVAASYDIYACLALVDVL